VTVTVAMITSVVHGIGKARGVIRVGRLGDPRREVEGRDEPDEIVQIVIKASSQ